LTIASEEDIRKIENTWKLPSCYLEFLKYYTPVHVMLKGIHLYGASILIKNQAGYAYNELTNEHIDDWPAGYIVIADKHADPFCIDLAKGDLSPVYSAFHGTGRWDFVEYTDSFESFIRKLI